MGKYIYLAINNILTVGAVLYVIQSKDISNWWSTIPIMCIQVPYGK